MTDRLSLGPDPTLDTTSLSRSNALWDAHRSLERTLARLWTATVRAEEVEGELEAARSELATLEADGKGDSPNARYVQGFVRRFQASAAQHRQEVAALRTLVVDLRERRDRLVPLVDPSGFPNRVTVVCTSDGVGGMSISTPVVRSRAGGVQIHVVNRIPNERVYLHLKGFGDPFPIDGGMTQDLILTDIAPVTLEIVCAYGRPSHARERPAHSVAVIPVERESSLPCRVLGSDYRFYSRFDHLLLLLLQRIGAPEGWPVSADAVGERNGEFVLDLDGYEGRFRLSAFAEAPDLVNTKLGTIPIIDRSHGLRLHATVVAGNVQQYTVAASDLWITFHVFPRGQRIGDDAMVDWFRSVGRIVRNVHPPARCG